MDPDKNIFDGLQKFITIYKDTASGGALTPNHSKFIYKLRKYLAGGAPPLQALHDFLDTSDDSNLAAKRRQFLLVLTNAIWYYSSQYPKLGLELYDDLIEKGVYAIWASPDTPKKGEFSLDCVQVTNKEADYHLIVSRQDDDKARDAIMGLASSVQFGTGGVKDDPANHDLWAKRNYE
jgi:hypothetical protein